MEKNVEAAIRVFEKAAEYTASRGYEPELRRHALSRIECFTEHELLREAAWVVLCGGFREATVRRLFDSISLCFCDWESAEEIVRSSEACRVSALKVFRHSGKIDAIVRIAHRIASEGFSTFQLKVKEDPVTQLRSLPYVGPVTALHLAKNLGLDVAKPDRHLVRLSEYTGFKDVQELCRTISSAVGETVRMVDLVLWRYLADTQWSTIDDRAAS